jgi:virulence-associated protein VapD
MRLILIIFMVTKEIDMKRHDEMHGFTNQERALYLNHQCAAELVVQHAAINLTEALNG